MSGMHLHEAVRPKDDFAHAQNHAKRRPSPTGACHTADRVKPGLHCPVKREKPPQRGVIIKLQSSLSSVHSGTLPPHYSHPVAVPP